MIRTASIMQPLPVRSPDAVQGLVQSGCSLPPVSTAHRMQPLLTGIANAGAAADLLDARRY